MINYMAIPGITKQQINIDRIKEIVCNYYNISEEDLEKRTKRTNIVRPKQICHYFALKNNLGTSTEIGEKIGNMDHATVLYSRKVTCNMIETDRQFRQTIKKIEKRLKGES